MEYTCHLDGVPIVAANSVRDLGNLLGEVRTLGTSRHTKLCIIHMYEIF